MVSNTSCPDVSLVASILTLSFKLTFSSSGKRLLNFFICFCVSQTTPQHRTAKLHCTADVKALRHLHPASSLSLNVHHTRLSAVGDQAFPVAAAHIGTVSPNMSRPHPLCLFSEVALRLSSSGVPPHDFYCKFYTVTLRSFLDTKITLLLTYMYFLQAVNLLWLHDAEGVKAANKTVNC